MTNLWHALYSFVTSNQNQFASGGILLMALGAVGAYLRKVPTTVWNWLLKRFTLSITVTEQSPNIQKSLQLWLDTNPAFKNNRRIDARETGKSERGQRVVLSLSEGTHWFWFEGRPIRVTFERSEDAKGGYDRQRPEKLTLQMIGRDKNRVKKFLDLIQQDFDAFYAGRTGLYIYNDDYWRRNGELPARSLDSVVLDGDTKEVVLADIKRFFASEDFYTKTNIPYHRGYLLHGLPGTGKTSLMAAIANALNLNVYQMNLSRMDDAELIEAMNSVPRNSLVLFEDIDCSFGKRAEPKKETTESKIESKIEKLIGVSLSGFLNAIDGLRAPRGIVMFMTTNHIENLDPAMIRPGRCDVHVEFKEITTEQKTNLYHRFFGVDGMFEFAGASKATTPAQFQEELMVERARRDTYARA